jgi:hypothetical protein
MGSITRASGRGITLRFSTLRLWMLSASIGVSPFLQSISKPGREQPSPMPNGKGTSMPPQLFWQPGFGWTAWLSATARTSRGSKSAVHIDGRMAIIALTQSPLYLLRLYFWTEGVLVY